MANPAKGVLAAIKNGGHSIPTKKSTSMIIYFCTIYLITVHGAMLSNPTVTKWWEIGNIPPNVPADRFVQLYDKALKNFDLGDLIVGAAFLIMADVAGRTVVMLIISTLLIFAYSVYYVPYSSSPAVEEQLMIASTIIQGASLNALAISFFHLAYMPALNFPGGDSLAFMLLNGCFDVGTLMTPLFYYLTSAAGIPAKGLSIYLMCSAIVVLLFSMFVLPMPVHVAAAIHVEHDMISRCPSVIVSEDPEPTAMNASLPPGDTLGAVAKMEKSDEDSIAGVAPPARPTSFFKELFCLPVGVPLLLWACFAATKVLINGSALTTAVARQYGEESGWMIFLENFAWVGFLSGLVFGKVADKSLGLAFFLFNGVLSLLSAWLMYFEGKYTTGPAVICFYVFRGSLHGSLFFIIKRIIWNHNYEGRIIASCTCTTGIILKVLVEYLIMDLTFVEGEEYPYNKDYKGVMFWLGIVLIPVMAVTVWWWKFPLKKRLAELAAVRGAATHTAPPVYEYYYDSNQSL